MLLLTLALAQGPGKGIPVTAFVGVNVVSVGDGRVLRDQTVIVEGGRISWVGPRHDGQVPTGANRIEPPGSYLLPGFADMHVHLGDEQELLTYIANGITTVRNMWGEERHLTWRRQIERDSLLGPHIVTAGQIVDGSPPSMPSMRVVLDPALARPFVMEHRRADFDFIKVYNSLPKVVYDSIIAIAATLKLPVAGHVPFEVGLRGALAAKQASIEHLRGYVAELVPATAPVQPGPTLRSRSVVWNYIDRARLPGLVEATRVAGVWNCPTLVVTPHNMQPVGEHAKLVQRPEVRFLRGQTVPDRSQISYLRDFADSDYVAALKGLDAQMQVVAALHGGGARLLAGTDSWLAGFALQEELKLFEAAGVPRADVLRIATRGAAEFFGQGGQWGEIVAGQRADLQLVTGNPLESLDALPRRLGVMVSGHWYARADLDARLAGLAELRASQRANGSGR